MRKRILYLYFAALLFSQQIFQSCDQRGDNQAYEVAIPDSISYNFDIRPILSDKCFKCHGPDANKRQVGLRLDVAEEAYKVLDENPSWHAIVPGKPELSQVFLRISSQDTALQMPLVLGSLLYPFFYKRDFARCQRQLGICRRHLQSGILR